MTTMQQSLEGEAERLIRHAAADRLPVDAGTVQQARDLVGDAYRSGRDDVFRHVRAMVDPLTMRDALEDAVSTASPEAGTR